MPWSSTSEPRTWQTPPTFTKLLSPILVISVTPVCSQGSKKEGMEDISAHIELSILISRVLRILELGIKMQEKESSEDKEARY